MNLYLTSDLHFFHGNILKYCQRLKYLNQHEIDVLNSGDEGLIRNLRISRESIDRMNFDLIDNINKNVQPEDCLWFLGDFVFGRDSRQKAVEILDQINCKNVHIVWGNHDRCNNLRSLFQTSHDQVMIAYNGNQLWIGQDEIGSDKKARRAQKIMLNHYLMAIWNGSHKGVLHAYGHSHSGAEDWADRTLVDRASMDVGVDNINKLFGEYRPISFSEFVNRLRNRKNRKIDHHG